MDCSAGARWGGRHPRLRVRSKAGLSNRIARRLRSTREWMRSGWGRAACRPWHRAFFHHFVEPALLGFPGRDHWSIVAAFYDSRESAKVEFSHLHGSAVARNTTCLEDGEHAGFENCSFLRIGGRGLGRKQKRVESQHQAGTATSGSGKARHTCHTITLSLLNLPYTMSPTANQGGL